MRKKLIEDLTKVGKNKPLGYLYTNFIRELGFDPQKLKSELEGKGLKTFVFEQGKSLYVCHFEALKKLLNDNRQILERSGWPTEPDKFVKKLQEETAPSGTPLFNVIADAFNDRFNDGRCNKSFLQLTVNFVSRVYNKLFVTTPTGILQVEDQAEKTIHPPTLSPDIDKSLIETAKALVPEKISEGIILQPEDSGRQMQNRIRNKEGEIKR